MSFSTILEQLQQDELRLQESAGRRERTYSSGWPVDENCTRSRGSAQAAAAGYQDSIEASPEVSPDSNATARIIALELGLNDAMSVEEIKRIRRDFALRNHPDVVADGDRMGATMRMQIANLMIDEALHKAVLLDALR